MKIINGLLMLIAFANYGMALFWVSEDVPNYEHATFCVASACLLILIAMWNPEQEKKP